MQYLQTMILGTPFLTLLYPFSVTEKGIVSNVLGKEIIFEFIRSPETININALQEQNIIENKKKQINLLQQEIKYKRIEEQINNPKIQEIIKKYENKILQEICETNPTAFWYRKQHSVSLPYIDNFDEKLIPTKARPIQMNQENLEYCKKEIQEYLEKGLISPSKSPWSCAAFYVNNASEQERGNPRMVINYKPLNKVLKWIRYPLPNKTDLIKRIYNANIFSKFDMKSGYYQISVNKEDRYKTAFVVPFGHYEWNVMPQGLKNAPSEFQNIMNDIFNPYSKFSIVYLDDVLIFSKNLTEHQQHLDEFIKLIKNNGLVVSAKKIKIFQTKIRFLGYEIYQRTITPIQRSLEFTSKFPDQITDKNQLQRFLGCVNYIADFIPNCRTICAPLYKRLRKNSPPWNEEMTQAIITIKKMTTKLPCLGIPDPQAFLIIETDASEIGYGGILKQQLPNSSKEQIVRYYSGTWHTAALKYSTIKKEIYAIVLCVQKFQDDLFNKRFLIRTDCKAAPSVLTKDVQNLVSKHIFARWQALLSCFDFDIEHIKGKDNSLPDFLTREFLQAST